MKRIIILLIILSAIAAVWYYVWKQEHAQDNKGQITLYGNVDIRQVELGFRVEGKVAKMLFQEGDIVKPGQLMAYLDPQPYEDQVAQAEGQMASAEASYKNAERVLKRRNELIGTGSVSQEDMDNANANVEVTAAQLKQAKAALGVATTNYKDTKLYSPTEGFVFTRIREPGTVLTPSVPIYTISIKDPIWIRAYVNEPNLAKIYPGMPAEVFSDTPGTPVYKGKIGFISPIAEFTPKTVQSTDLRTDLVYRLRIYIDNPDKWLRQGMPVTVRLTDDRVHKKEEPGEQ